jgi:outer membrane protein insertion porin family
MNYRAVWTAFALLMVPCVLWAADEIADPNFTVSDIKIEGLQRISEGTVFNYLPVNIGDQMDAQRIREALRALYATGFFRDVELRRDGTTLLIAVLERPSLESVDIKGNKDIKTEDLQKSLRTVGLSAGKTFNRSTLEDVTQYLTDQYYSRGKYAVSIKTTEKDLPNNRIRVSIDIKEGSRAKIREINIVGNTHFKAKEILETLTLTTPNLTSWYKETDRYSRESLQGDLEKIQQFYQDRGYANYRTDSVQVAIAPDKRDIFITVNITEGIVYKLGDIKIAGATVVPQDQLTPLIFMKPGEIYSQKKITATQEAIKNRLGAEGFFFARVDPVPTTDEANKTVAITLFIEPGNRAYVRQISFKGSTRSNDETLRRELRQLEGGLMSNVALERSKQRIQQQPFIEEVSYETTQVPGTPDLVDVVFTVKERPSAQIGGGIGYSAAQKFILNANFSDSDFLGSGENIGVQADSGRYQRVYSFASTNPYVNADGLWRQFSVNYRDSTQFVATSSNFKSESAGAGLTYGYPVTEYQGVTAGVNLQRVDLLTYGGSSAQQSIDWVDHNGHSYLKDVVSTAVLPDGSTVTSETLLHGTQYKTVEASIGWTYLSLNRGLFADRGIRNSISLSIVPPGLDVRYYVANYSFAGYLPLIWKFTLAQSVTVTYGAPLGNTTALPPYRRMFAGGPDSIRGFYESSLGPKDSNGNPYGGNFLTVSRTELILPLPEKWQTSARATLFFDYGNVFSTDKTQYLGRDEITPVDYEFGWKRMKESTGVAVQWLAPQLGIFRFSLGFPLNKYLGNATQFADRTENFQFTVGQSF